MDKKLFHGITAQDVFERLKFVFNANTSKEFAQKAGFSESGISSAIKRNSVPYGFCAEISLRYGIPLDWLIFGDVDGNTFFRSIEPAFFQRAYGKTAFASLQAADGTTVLNDLGVQFINLYSTYITFKSTDSFDDKNSILKIPFNKDWLDDRRLDINNLICLQNKGDSMQPDIANGDIILINRAEKYGDGIFAIRFNDMLRIKRLQWLTDNTIRISSNNPLYEPETVNPIQTDEKFEIIGICHTKLSRFAQ